MLGASACATAGGIHHVVGPGENLYRIGKAYGVAYEDLARANRMKAPYRLEIGDEVYVPGAERQLPVSIITPAAVDATPPPQVKAPASLPVPVGRAAGGAPFKPSGAVITAGETPVLGPAKSLDSRTGHAGFAWPLAGRLSSSFGKRARGHHDGIDISAPKGTAVYAARDGKVIFSDRLSGYGNVLIVEHTGGYTTVYAHNDANLVRKGSRVRRGDRIATVGDTGRARGAHLHFEVRKSNVARNPLYYLPGATRVAAAR
jgi:murein DD-endopeptidase MepM/ murein hydrolase activator NlpD